MLLVKNGRNNEYLPRSYQRLSDLVEFRRRSPWLEFDLLGFVGHLNCHHRNHHQIVLVRRTQMDEHL